MPPTRPTREVLAEVEQVTDSLQIVYDMTTRLDERVKILIERQKEIDDHIGKLLEMQNNLFQRLVTVESILNSKESELLFLNQKQNELMENIHHAQIKLETISLRLNAHDNRWYTIFDGVWKILLMLIAGYILWKLGWQSPPLT